MFFRKWRNPISSTVASVSREFMFPLNVYSWVLEHNESYCKYLHFGIFADQSENIVSAQKRSTDLLLAYLPPPPARILEVGTGTGALLVQLRELGYEVEGINPDQKQIDFADMTHKGALGIRACTFETYETSRRFDVILLQEVSQYIDLECLFSRAAQLLDAEGILLIIDEMKANDLQPNLHAIHDYEKLGRRYNYVQMINLDLTEKAMPTLSYLHQHIQSNLGQISSDLGLPIEVLHKLLDDVRACLKKYQDGGSMYCMHGYRFTEFA